MPIDRRRRRRSSRRFPPPCRRRLNSAAMPRPPAPVESPLFIAVPAAVIARRRPGQRARPRPTGRAPASSSAVDLSVANVDRAGGVGRHVGVVGHQDDRNPLGVEPLKHPQDLHAGVRVEVAGRLVGQDQRGLVHQARAMATRCCCPPDICDGSWSAPIGQAHVLQEQLGPVGRLLRRGPRRRVVQAASRRCSAPWSAAGG